MAGGADRWLTDRWLTLLERERDNTVGDAVRMLGQILESGRRAKVRIEVVHPASERAGVDVRSMGDWEATYDYVIPEGPPRTEES